jgi:hypothetical protein
VLEAGRGRFATALYREGECIEPPRAQVLDQLIDALDEPTLLIGELNSRARARLERQPNARLASPAANMRRAGFLAELGWLAARAGEVGDPRTVDALYLPPPS